MTFALQWLNLLCANIGLVVLCGQSLKVNIARVQAHLSMLCKSSLTKRKRIHMSSMPMSVFCGTWYSHEVIVP